ncbi:MAG TPA: 3-deoxy-7-phosphoheptulonate synthase [Anaerovoracaceae bacterium]|nr:3-deoxy-7-phosphoheptulonate synthase [Anaerovoracaceae bacterium]
MLFALQPENRERTRIKIGDTVIGEGCFTVIAGPCSVESGEQINAVARAVKKSGASVLRGGAFKPRTSPYSFQGLHEGGLKLLLDAKRKTGLPVITEIMNQTQIPLMEEVDILQIGARNMQNFDLLKEVGKCRKPVLLKRGLANTVEELLMSAEYILSEGNDQVILCERGIRTFETMTRNTLDLSSVPLLKERTHLPVIVDPSHAAGIRNLVAPLSRAAIAVGADGLMIETNIDPFQAMSDADQTISLEEFDSLMREIKDRVKFERKMM